MSNSPTNPYLTLVRFEDEDGKRHKEYGMEKGEESMPMKLYRLVLNY